MPSLVSCLVIYQTHAWLVSVSHCPEFRAQLDMLLSLVVDVAQLVMEATKHRHLVRWKREREHMEDTHHCTMKDMATERVRPDLS